MSRLGASLLIALVTGAPLDLNRVHAVPEDGLYTDGDLAADDVKDTNKKTPAKIYRVLFSAGRTYTITLRSKTFDSFLRLEDAVGKELARDDDSGGKLDARIRFSCARDGVYQIIATSYDDHSGSYTLSIRPEKSP